MKAIQVRYLPCTTKKLSRLKCWAEGCKPITEIRNDMDMDAQAHHLAKRYAIKMQWGHIVGFGSIGNGDYVATLGDK